MRRIKIWHIALLIVGIIMIGVGVTLAFSAPQEEQLTLFEREALYELSNLVYAIDDLTRENQQLRGELEQTTYQLKRITGELGAIERELGRIGNEGARIPQLPSWLLK